MGMLPTLKMTLTVLLAAVVVLCLSFPISLAGISAGDLQSGTKPPDPSLLETVLGKYVLDNGKVRYQALRHNIAPLRQFVDQIARVSPDSHPQLFPNRRARLAYWLNAYNALVLYAFASEYPEKKNRLLTPFGRWKFFYWKKFTVGGQELSLAEIENDIIRKRFREPRIHFAIVCASAGCPRLGRTAFTEDNVEALLEAQTKFFLNEPRNVRVDRKNRIVWLSKLFDWYSEDFGKTQQDILNFVASYNDEVFKAIQAAPSSWGLRFFDYDWSPNAAQE